MNIRELSQEIASFSGAILSELDSAQKASLVSYDDVSQSLRNLSVSSSIEHLIYQYIGLIRAADSLGLGLVRGKSGLYIGCCE